MASQPVGISSLRRSPWNWAIAPLRGQAFLRRPAIVWWPTSLPGSDLESSRRKAPPARRRIRRGRIQLVAA